MKILEFLLYALAFFLSTRYVGEIVFTIASKADHETPYLLPIVSIVWAVIIVFF